MITFAANQASLGGGEIMLLALARAARDLGHRVQLAVPGDSAVFAAAGAAGLTAVPLAGPDRRSYLRALRRWDRRERSGLLWCNGLVPALATTGHGHRLVHLHQLPHGRAQRAALAVARAGVALTVVPSRFMAAGLPGAWVLPNWTDDLGDVVRRPGAGLLGYLGRLSLDKGVGVLCAALRSLPGTRLLVAGETRFVGEDEAAVVRGLLDALGERVERPGWIAPRDFFASVELAVFPSVWGEPFGLVVAEAMSARVPFVVSDAGALVEVAGAGHPWVARAGDPADLARVVRAALAGSGAELGPARERWEREFSPQAGSRRLGDLLGELNDHLHSE